QARTTSGRPAMQYSTCMRIGASRLAPAPTWACSTSPTAGTGPRAACRWWMPAAATSTATPRLDATLPPACRWSGDPPSAAPFPPITRGVRPMKPYASAVVLILVLFAAGLARAQAGKDRDPGRDRDAILAMQGEYLVDFAFDETVLLAPGYERAPAQRSGGDEVVIVVEDTPARIVLQHILVDPGSGHVTKHWRQDWTYEATRRWEFVAYQTWRLRDIPAEKSSGAWTQCVYEVSDAPRYCGTGRWNHRYGVSTWTSDRSWRPLPRREYTRRDDYNAMNVQNRHTVVPGGWTHEQDNTKTVRRADGSTERTIARESGFNDYQKATDVDFAPAYAYWNATRDYWARVRA